MLDLTDPYAVFTGKETHLLEDADNVCDSSSLADDSSIASDNDEPPTFIDSTFDQSANSTMNSTKNPDEIDLESSDENEEDEDQKKDDEVSEPTDEQDAKDSTPVSVSPISLDPPKFISPSAESADAKSAGENTSAVVACESVLLEKDIGNSNKDLSQNINKCISTSSISSSATLITPESNAPTSPICDTNSPAKVVEESISRKRSPDHLGPVMEHISTPDSSITVSPSTEEKKTFKRRNQGCYAAGDNMESLSDSKVGCDSPVSQQSPSSTDSAAAGGARKFKRRNQTCYNLASD